MQTPSCGDSAGGVVSKQRRYLQRHPSVDPISAVKDGPEQIGGPREIFKCQLEKQFLSGLALIEFLADRSIVRTAVFNRVVKDRGIRSEACNGKLVDIALECTAI